MQTPTSVAPAPSLGIREFSRQSGYSEAKVRRAMRELSIKGQFQGRGKATLLNPSEQERLALHIDEVELQGSDRPSTPPKKTPAPKTSATAKPIKKPLTQPAEQSVVQPTKKQPETDAIAPAESTDAPYPSHSGNSEAENAAVLDQLWEARQAIHNSDEPLPAQPNSSSNADLNTAPAPTDHSSVSPQPQPAQPIMNQTPPPAPHDNIPAETNPHHNQQLSAPVPPQSAPAYYDPYFDAHPAIAPTTQIQPGNHRQTLAPPNLPESYDLGQFRSEDTITTLADPGAIAAQAMGAINALVQGMDADIQQQRIHLEETQRAAQTLRLKAKQLQEKKIEYMIQSSTLGQAQQQSTLEIQEALEGIQVLGKSPSDEPTSPSSSPSSPSPSA